jgi:hypothetical protein
MEGGTVNVVTIFHTYLWVLILTSTVLCLFFPPCTQFCNIWTCLWSMLLMLSLQCCDVVLCCQELPNNTAPHHITLDVTSPVLLVYKFVAQVFYTFLLWVIALWKVVLICCIVLVNTLLHRSKSLSIIYSSTHTFSMVSCDVFLHYALRIMVTVLYFSCYVFNSSDLWTVLVLPGLKGNLFGSF